MDHGFDGLGLENFGSGHISAQHDHVADFAVADLVSDLAAGNIVGGQICAMYLICNHVAVDKHAAAGEHAGLELLQGGLVERDQLTGGVEYRRANRFVGEDHRAVGSAAAHFRTIGGSPSDEETFSHAGLCQILANGQAALAAEAGNDDFFFHLTAPPRCCP